jgi:hypothetical protein
VASCQNYAKQLFFVNCLTLNMKALWSFETRDTIHTQLTRQHHIPGEFYLQVLPPQIITSFIAGYQCFMLQVQWLIQMIFQQPISPNILSCHQTLTSNFFRKLHDNCNLLNHCEASKIIHNLKPNFMPTWTHGRTFHQIPGHFCENDKISYAELFLKCYQGIESTIVHELHANTISSIIRLKMS